MYLRLHGIPLMYYSAYDDAALDAVARMLRASDMPGCTCWCVFDNTARGAAADDAMALRRKIG